MGILSKFKEGVESSNKNRKERKARSMGFSGEAEYQRSKRKAEVKAINRLNKKKRTTELTRLGKEATMTKAEKIQRGVKNFRKEMDSIQKESGGMFGQNNVTRMVGAPTQKKAKKRKPRKRKAKKSNPMESDNHYASGFQTSRFF